MSRGFVEGSGEGAEIERLDGTYPDGLWSKPVPGASVRVELHSDSSIAAWGFCVDQLATSGPPPWLRRAPLTVARSRLAAAAVGGKMYAIGGESSAPGIVSAAVAPGGAPQALDVPAATAGIVAAYDPATNAWTGKTAMPVGLSNISAAAIDDKIFVPGGFDGANASAALHVYDPISDTWALRAPLPAARYAAAVTAVAGRLYVLGGIGPGGTDNACLVYDPAADAWSACAPLPAATAWGAAGVVAGTIYVSGGATVSNTEVSTLYAYDPATDQWAVRSPMGVARSGLAVVGYGDYLYAIGGGWAAYLSLTERFDPAANRWQTVDPLDVGRRSLAAAELGGQLYAVGGFREGYSNVVEAYTPPGPAQYPTLAVAPSTFEAHLTDQPSLQSVLTISNTGQAELTFAIRDTETTSPTHVTIHLPPRVVSAAPPGAKSLVEAKTLPAQDLRVPFGLRRVGDASGIKVLIVTPDGGVSDLAAVLAAFPDLAVEVFDLSRAPTLAELRPHDVVLTTNNWTWAFGGINPVELGNVLADYVDGGGKVVVGNYGYDFSMWAIQGRFMDQDYGPFGRATADLGYPVTLDAYLQEHPIMQGVTDLAETAIHQDPLALASATLVASWSDGTPLVAAKPRVVGVNLLLSMGAGYARWSGDVPTLLHNILVWLASGATGEARWLDQAPATGSVPPGSSVPVTVTFSRVDLGGGIYTADMLIKSNDPWREQVGVPVTLTVHIGPLDHRLYLPVMFDPFP